MEKATRKNIDEKFVAFLKRRSLPALNYDTMHGYALDHNRHYGGYKIVPYKGDHCPKDITSERFSGQEILAFFRIDSQFSLHNEGK